MTTIAVVILNWNGIHHLKNFLPSVTEYSDVPGVKVIVADNNSTDDSLTFIAENYPQIETILLDDNYGFAGGYNRALKQIEAKYYLLLNSDIEVTENWLKPLLELMETNKDIAACQPKIRAYRNKEQFEYAGASGGYIDKLGYPFCRGRILSEIENDDKQYDNRAEIFWATGACFMVRAEVYRQTTGLDPDFFAHMEEIDLCWQIHSLGYKIVAEPASVIYHVGGGTLPNDNPRKLYLNYRNSLFMLYKNLPRPQLLSVLLVRMVLDGASGMVYFLTGRFSFFWAVLRAHLSFYRHIPKLTKSRRQLPKSKHFPETVYRNSILKQFFINKNTTFSRLEKANLEGIC